MGDMREVFDLMKELRAEQKEKARAANVVALEATGLPWRRSNNGAHWMLRGGPDVDVWPGTGRWRFGKQRGRGIERLLRRMGVHRG